MDERRVREIIQEELQKFFEEIVLPTIQNIVKYEIEESEKRMMRKIDQKLEKLEEKLEEKLNQKLDEKLGGIYTLLDRIVSDIDDMKIEKASGNYLFHIHSDKIEDHEKRITVLEMA